MTATVYFALSTEGQKDALRRGLPPQTHQTLITTIEEGDLDIATILQDGTVHISAYSTYDLPTGSVLGHLTYPLQIHKVPDSARELLDTIHRERAVQQSLCREPMPEFILLMKESRTAEPVRRTSPLSPINAGYRRIMDMFEDIFANKNKSILGDRAA